ncbi:hypothetical protein [Anaeromyxobacter paludicola]|uniref:Cytochrome c7-like domain-containing protein n=1 Tax=Anaeromyxobacter paludicola TaxID=2918171 RepID=A0ABM7X573_9BACT|nr:hypothetical protein [Anaeromyxobacter paludicola]BDG06964.1 hypothetical protein AMPC_00770 [Anaeromyxobacter paludicola]
MSSFRTNSKFRFSQLTLAALIVMIPVLAHAWGSSGSTSSWGSSGSTSTWGGSSGGSWGGTGGTTQTGVVPLTLADCLQCHTSMATATGAAAVHHAIAGFSCSSCHKSGGRFLISDCTVCHSATGAAAASAHQTDTHKITYDSCGQCHHDPVAAIHWKVVAGWNGGSTMNSAVCFFCHLSSDPGVKSVVDRGVAGTQTACSSCHGQNWGH